MDERGFPSWLFDGGEIEAAFRVAYRAHAGVADKHDVDYIWHPIAVATMVRDAGGSDSQIAAALMHDVVEDTDISFADLLAAGFRAATVAIVRQVTREPGVAYATFVDAIEGEGVLVKLADLMHNTDPSRVLRDPESGRALPPRQRYVRALAVLTPKLPAHTPRPVWLRDVAAVWAR